MPMTLLSVRKATERMPATASFKVLPEMTKHEVKEYLSKIYGLPVKKVNTQNYLGKRMRLMGRKGMAYRKEPDWKKAIVTFPREITDLGVTTKIAGIFEEKTT